MQFHEGFCQRETNPQAAPAALSHAREQLEDRHRLLPGIGILPLKEIVAALKRIGYDRVTSVEIFRPEYWERDPAELAREARAAAARVLGLQ